MESSPRQRMPEIMRFFERYSNLKSQQDSIEQLVQDILIYTKGTKEDLESNIDSLSKELEDTRLDLEDAQTSRRQLQQNVRRCEKEMADLKDENRKMKSNNPYVVLLIDGDGLIFRNQWVRQGIEGGKKAAFSLRAAVVKHCGSRGDEVEVLAVVVANVMGLAKAMQRDGSIDDVSELKEFTQGFTQARAGFDFIDVGYGKERADSKIREMTRWHLKNYNCKQILLGIAHDSGYAPFLDEILRDDATKQRVTVIEGVPVVQDLLSTGVEVLDLEEDLFRRDKLEERVTRYPNSRQVNRSTESAISTSKGAPVAVQSISRLETPPPDHNVPKSPLVSYANPSGSSLAAAEPPPKITMPLTRVMSGPSVAKNGGRISQEASWVAGLRRVDKKYNVANEILESIRKRKEYNKLCNHYFLQNKCPKGIGCPFVHDYSTTKEELNAIRVVARVNPCTFGQDCEDMQCFYGHHCPSVTQGWCTHPYCRFPPESHPPGTQFRHKGVVDNEPLGQVLYSGN